MTIEIEIKNHDAALSVEVEMHSLNRDTGQRVKNREAENGR